MITTRINIYVDDPIVAICAPRGDRDLTIGMILLMWSALGLPLSLGKAVSGREVTWTSIHLQPAVRGVHVQVKQEIVDDASASTTDFLSRNIVSKKELRKYVGQLTHIASFIAVMKPFLGDLYAAVYSVHGNAPAGCIWQRQIAHVLA